MHFSVDKAATIVFEVQYGAMGGGVVVVVVVGGGVVGEGEGEGKWERGRER